MWFDIFVYNVALLITALLISIFLFMYLFRNKYITIIDPLVNMYIWLAAHFAFLTGYIGKYGISFYPIYFLLVLIVLIFVLNTRIKGNMFFVKNVSKYTLLINKMISNGNKFKFVYILLILVLCYSKQRLFLYMLSHSPIEWTLYRFELLQGREVVSRILEIGCIPYLYLFSFINIFIIKKWKKFSILVLLINLLISIMAGGRSSFLSLLFAFGAFVNYFQFRFSSISQYTYFNISKYKKKTFKLYLVLLIISLIIASFVSSTYNNEKIEYGAKIILNRVFASADGLEYYMNYDGSKYIENGIYPFFLSIFGVYLKGTGEAEYKNIGHQLSELMTGQSLTFAHGANYTIFLQNVVLGYYWFPIYTTLIVFLVAKLRNSRNFSVVWLAISYYLYNSCFTMILDLEYYFLVVLSGFICYCLFIFPVFAIKKNHLNKF